jgi:predicted ATPase/DNA-binding SARP family transcriptional activator
VKVRLLGTMEALRDGVAASLGGPLQRAVLANLALHAPHAVSLEQLVDDLWDVSQPVSATHTLRAYVSRLRRSLAAIGCPDVLVTSGPGYRLDVATSDVDALYFAELVARGRRAFAGPEAGSAAELIERALSLWRGPALADVRQAAFAGPAAARLDGTRLDAVEALVDARLASGEQVELVSELERLVAEHPYRERMWAQLMTALYRSGRQTEALRAFSRVRKLLAEGLGIEPGEPLRRLEQEILNQDPVLDVHPAPSLQRLSPPRDLPGAPTRGGNLPNPLSCFVGRADELALVGELLGEHRLVTLTGPGGVGKSRLSLEVASRLRESFGQGVWFVDFASLEQPELVAETTASALGAALGPRRPALDCLVDYLSGRHLLVFMDNCEHLLGAIADMVGQLLIRAPQLTVLAASREGLRVEGEVTCSVPPLSLPEPQVASEDPASVFAYDAVRLFVERAKAARPDIAIGATNAAALVEVVRRLDGLPLAIELAAARLDALSLADLVRRLDQPLDLLTRGPRGAHVRHQTLAATLDWSYRVIDQSAQATLRHLSVFAGSFTAEAAASVLGAGAGAAEAFEALCDVVSKSLVVLIDTGGGARYRLLETVQEYAGRLLVEHGEASSAKDRLLEWSVGLAKKAEEGMWGADTPKWSERLELEVDNLRAALGWAKSGGDVERGLVLGTSLQPFWVIRAYLGEGRRWLGDLLGLDAGSAATRARALGAAGELAYLTGRPHRSPGVGDRGGRAGTAVW